MSTTQRESSVYVVLATSRPHRIFANRVDESEGFPKDDQRTDQILLYPGVKRIID